MIPKEQRHYEPFLDNGEPRCQGWKKSTDSQCTRPARSGFRACGHHGSGFAKRERDGTRKNPALAPMGLGTFSNPVTTNTRLRDLIERYRQHPNPNDMSVEIATMRALLFDFIERATGNGNGGNGNSGAPSDLDVADARVLMTDLARIIEANNKVEMAKAVPIGMFMNWSGDLMTMIAACVTPEELVQIKAGIDALNRKLIAAMEMARIGSR